MVYAEGVADEVNITQAHKNVLWKMLLDLLYMHHYTITGWPAQVPAVGPDFNVKALNADELQALIVPFLKEQMTSNYDAEQLEDNEQDGSVIVPASSFCLMEWTSGKLA